MSYLPVKPNPLNLEVKEPAWKSLIQKLDMVSYHCSMPVLENVQVSLKEVLEVRGQPLGEWELWGVLFQTTMAVQDIFLRGQACKDGIPQYLVTPDNLLCSARGRVIVNVCFASKVKGTSYWCQELKDENFPSQSCILDKIYVFTIGQTILHAAHYGATEKNQKKFSPLLKTVFQAMCQTDTDLRMVLADIIEVCSLHAKKYMNGYTFVDAVKQLHHEVLGSLPESEILTQVDQDFTRDSYKDDAKGSNEDVTEVDYETKFLPYGERLGYHPEMSPNVKCHTKQVILTPKERWKEAYKKVLKEIQKSKVSLSNKEEVVSAWKAHKAHESIFRVYEELTERRKMLELLRLSINLDPVAPADMDQNPFLIAGLKPKTIAELVLLLQRPNKQNTLVSKSPVEVPKISDDTATNNFATSQMNIPSCSSIDDDSYERPFYDIDKIALNQPFSRNNSEFQSFSGPEFIINKIKPHIRIVPFCSDKEFHNSAFTVIVKLLTGEALDVECSSSVTGKQLYQAIADHLKLRERYLFGLAYMHGDEHIFIDKKQCMLDLLHSCSAIAKDKIQMHFRVKFYLNDIHLMRSPNLRHLYYLQLRKDLLDDDFHYDTTIALTLGGLALQSEFGNYDSLSHSKEYFLLEHYLSFTCIQQLNRNDAKAKLRDHHVNLQGVSKELAELKFIQGMMKSQEYGCHLHKVFQDKRNISSAVWLGIRSTGIEVYGKISGKRSLCQTYPWQNIKRISFCKKYFCIAPRTESYTGKHVVYRFYTSVLLRSQYLFNVAMAHHKFFLKLRTVSRASEIFIEDLDEEHHYFCDNSGVEKEIGCDLYDTKGKFQLKTKTLQHRSSSQNDLEFLNDPYTLDISQPKMDFQLKQTLGDSIEVQQKKILPKLVTRSSSAPDPVKRSHYASRHSSVKELSTRVSSTIPRVSCGKRSMKFVRLHKDPNCGFGMVITCGNTYDTVLHGAFIESVHPGSPAHLDGNISPGDQIMSVNGTDVQNDHFLTVVDLLQYSTNSVDLVIAKANKTVPGITSFIKKDILEKPFTKSKAWIVGNKNSKSVSSPEKVEDNSTVTDMPIPKPRKKWIEQEKSLNFDVPDLTLNHASNANQNENWKKEVDRSTMTRDNIPDIIASQMKHLVTSVSSDVLNKEDENCQSYLPLAKSVDDNFLLPGEVFHVVLDKKGGSLGLNIYQGTESTCTEQRHIYIHSVIPNGAADLDGRIKPGDKLLEVNGVLLENLSYQEVVTKLRESPQVAHLVLEKGNLIETQVESEIIPKIDNQYSKYDKQSSALGNDSDNIVMQHSTSITAAKYSDFIHPKETETKRKQSSASAEACFKTYKDCDSGDQMSYSSLPTVTNEIDSCFYSAKDIDSSLHLSECQTDLPSFSSQATVSTQDINSLKHHTSSPTYAKVSKFSSPAYRFQNSLTSYSSTPNLAETSDEEDKNEVNSFLYRNKSTDCLITPHFLAPHQALLDFYQNYSYVRGSSSNLHQIPAVPIRKKKLKKLEDIYNYCNSDTTFEVSVCKSSRGLGLSISGGSDVFGRDPFSQLIRIRKLYPLQPALECGKLALGDVILEVNSIKMVGLTNTEALEVLRSAPTEVILKVFRPSKSLIPSFSTFKGGSWPFFDSSSSSASSSLSRTETNTYNVETGEFEITFIKRGGSLGFTISRTETLSEVIQEGIYVKALVREPAVSDGRIQPGDRILQVNGTDVSSMSHAEAIEFMRNTPNTVILKLFRHDPPLTPGFIEEEYSISKPLRWEAVGFLNDRLKQKESSDEGSTPKRKIKRKLERISNAPSNSSTESESSSSSSGQEHVIEENIETPDEADDLNMEGAGLQRNQRPKSLDMLNSSDRRRCPAFPDEESFHRQSSVMCSNADSKNKSEEGENESSAKKAGKTLLKWRGTTMSHSEEPDGLVACLDFSMVDVPTGNENETSIESMSDEEKPVPFPRTSSCAKEWVHTFDVDLDRGWHGRLGFSLFDPPLTSPGSSRNMLPIAAEVKAVHPGSLAEKDGRIKVGDRLVEVNRECLLSKSAPEVIDVLRKTRSLIRMVFCRLETRT